MNPALRSEPSFDPALAHTSSASADWLARPGRRARLILIGLAGTGLLALLICLQFGAESISVRQSLRALGTLWPLSANLDRETDPATFIVLYLRLPRLLLACCVGGTLAVVGTCLQALLRNPLADPYVLGISSGATLGATIALTVSAIATTFGSLGLPLFALGGSVLVMLLLYRLSTSDRRLPLPTVLLMGVVINAILSALAMFVTSILSPTHLARVLSWLMGSLAAADTWRMSFAAGGLLIGLLVVMRHARHLNGLLVGEDTAHTLGIPVESVKRTLFFACAMMTGLAVAVSGMIGFVGMVVPHALRLLMGTDHRLLLPAAALGGGGFLMCADTLARTLLAPSELPVGVMTALIGGPLFVHLLIAHRHRQTIGALA